MPPPLTGLVDTATVGYQWLYIVLTAFCLAIVLIAANRIVYSPYGRTLRAMREREPAAAALGKNLVRLKMEMFVLGGVIAGLSGAILVGFIGVWAPATWLYPETIVLFAALIVGGRGNNLGALLGALLVPVGFEEATRFIPEFGPPGFIPAMQWVAIGLLIIGFLWFRPRGLLPEPRRVFAESPARGGAARVRGRDLHEGILLQSRGFLHLSQGGGHLRHGPGPGGSDPLVLRRLCFAPTVWRSGLRDCVPSTTSPWTSSPAGSPG